MSERAPEALMRIQQRISTLLNWHYKARGSKVCSECGQPYPCRTRLMLLGRETEAANTEKIRLK